MKNLLALAFVGIAFCTSAQKPKNTVCLERGHNIAYTTNKLPYTIDTKDSTVKVYPLPNHTTGKCSRCGVTMDNDDKEIRITTWRRNDKEPEVNTSAAPNNINWGNNPKRAISAPLKTSSLDDNKKVASLRNDTLFIYKRIPPFATIREQIRSKLDTMVYYKGKRIIFKTAVFDDAVFYTGRYGIDFY